MKWRELFGRFTNRPYDGRDYSGGWGDGGIMKQALIEALLYIRRLVIPVF
jgi:hypothetical protein